MSEKANPSIPDFSELNESLRRLRTRFDEFRGRL